MAQTPHAQEEFETSVSDQQGLLRSRIPTPMLKRIGAGHGDRLHFTVTGKDTIEVKILKGQGFSGDKYAPPVKQEKVAAKRAAKKGSKKAAAKKGGAGKGGKRSGPIPKPGAAGGGKKGRKTKVSYDEPEG